MIKVDTKSFVRLASDLKEVHRAALPNAVRFTLNDMAFDVKKIQLLPALTKSELIVRNPSFFKKYSGIDKATGWDINKMFSEVGMIPSGDASKAVERLKQQDIGGTLKDRNFVPDPKARTGNKKGGKVRQQNYLSKLKLMGHIQMGDKQGLIRAVTASKIESGGSGKGFVVIYGSILFEIIGFKRLPKQNTIKLHLKKLYTYKKDREIHLKPHHFMQKSAMETGKKLQELFSINAEKQLAKFKNRK